MTVSRELENVKTVVYFPWFKSCFMSPADCDNKQREQRTAVVLLCNHGDKGNPDLPKSP